MIRPIEQSDIEKFVSLGIDSGLFPEEESEILEKMMQDYFGGKQEESHCCVIDEDEEALAVAYYEPHRAADRTWYLTLIAVHGKAQGKGRGSALMQYIEADLQAKGQRLLLVETSGVPEFERTRQFYLNCGYEQEARVRDFYTDGDDMVLFRKALS